MQYFLNTYFCSVEGTVGEDSEQREAPCLEAADLPGAGHSCYLC